MDDPTRLEPAEKPDEFRLTTSDTQQPVWKKLRTHYEARLATLRARNDNTALDPVKTAALRGEIAAVRSFLALDQPAPGKTEVDPDDGE